MHGIARHSPRSPPHRRKSLMARQPDVWFRRSTGFYYTTIDGIQHKLDPDEKKSRDMLKRLLRKLPEEPAGKDPAFRRLADLFLEHSEKTNEKDTFAVHQLFLQSFCDHV